METVGEMIPFPETQISPRWNVRFGVVESRLGVVQVVVRDDEVARNEAGAGDHGVGGGRLTARCRPLASASVINCSRRAGALTIRRRVLVAAAATRQQPTVTR